MTLASENPVHAAAVGLAVEGLSVVRGGRPVIADVSFRLAGGQGLEIHGANGAGKSTLLRALAGLLPRASGAVRLEGGPAGAALAEQTHYLGHADGLKGALSAGQNLELAAGLFGSATRHAAAALAGLGLSHLIDLPVAYLSAVSGGVSRWRGSWSPLARSGSSTSRPRPSMPQPGRALRASWRITSPRAA